MAIQEGFIELTKYAGKRAGTTTTIVNKKIYLDVLKLVEKKQEAKKPYRNPFEGWLPTDELNKKIANGEVQTPEQEVNKAVQESKIPEVPKVTAEDDRVNEKLNDTNVKDFETISQIQPYFKLKAYAKTELGLEFDNKMKKADLLDMIKEKVNG